MGINVLPAVSGGVTQKVSTFTSTGTFTAPSNCSSVQILLVGGGGAGGGGRSGSGQASIGGSGGGGQVLKRTLTVTPGSSYTVTIGAGGSAGTPTSAGAVGSDSSFGSLATALGGGGGTTRNKWTNVTYQGTPRATGGGGWGNTNNVGGAGGGAGGSAFLYAMNTDVNYQPFPFNIHSTNMYLSGNNFRGTGGGMGTMSSPYSGTKVVLQTAGIGIDGYGNGAPGMAGGTESAFFVNGSYSDITPQFSGTDDPKTGTSGTANTGNGGVGGCASNSEMENYTVNGGAGGSGICIVTYWS